MTDDIPEAAFKRADVLAAVEKKLMPEERLICAFARYIAQHETFPDPDLDVVREIVAKAYEDNGWPSTAGFVRDGQWDGVLPVRTALACLKAGRKLERNGR